MKNLILFSLNISIFLQFISCGYDQGTPQSSGTIINYQKESSLIELNALVSNLTDANYLSLLGVSTSDSYNSYSWNLDSIKEKNSENNDVLLNRISFLLGDLNLFLKDKTVYANGEIKEGFYSLVANEKECRFSIVESENGNEKYRYRLDIYPNIITSKSYYFNTEFDRILILLQENKKVEQYWINHDRKKNNLNVIIYKL
ncbi:MAG: hypothetical protein HQK49_21660 [Oligoflexia bacterium]|nr:hypothetical protein [Oligoflexia bacterium]